MALLGPVTFAVGVSDQPQMGQDPSQPGWIQRRAASSSIGSAWVVGSGNSWVPAASTAAWAGEIAPSVNAWAVAVRGPRNTARAVRTAAWAAPAPNRSRARNQPAVEEARRPCSAPAAPRASRPASSWSQWPSRQSTSRRNPNTRSASTPSGRRSRSCGQLVDRCGQPGESGWGWVERVFESAAATL